jgi:Sec-independent protein secretion pathway component TatC
VQPEDLDARDASTAAAPPGEPVARRPRWLLLLVSAMLVVLGASVLAVGITSVTPFGLVSAPAVAGFVVSLLGFIILMRLSPLPRWRTAVVLCIVIVSMVASPPAWTVRALVAISLWAAFELGILATNLRLHLRHS